MHITGTSSGSRFLDVGDAHNRTESVQTQRTAEQSTKAIYEAVVRDLTEVPAEVRATIHRMGVLGDALRVVEEAGALLA